MTTKGLLCTEAAPWLLSAGEAPFGIDPAAEVKVTVPVSAGHPELPTTVALTNTGMPKGWVLNGTVHWPNWSSV